MEDDRILPPAESQTGDAGSAEIGSEQRAATILVVEDSQAVARVFRSALDVRGYQALMAATVAEALDISCQFRGAIDLLLTDLMLPDGSGYELAQQIRAERPGLRILYTSGYSSAEADRYGIDTAHMAFLQKPFRVADLLRMVRDLLDSPPAGS